MLTFHYRGSWGSGGVFTLKVGCDDAEALLASIATRGNKLAGVGADPTRTVLMGHSYGGYIAACALAKSPGILGTALIAPSIQ